MSWSQICPTLKTELVSKWRPVSVFTLVSIKKMTKLKIWTVVLFNQTLRLICIIPLHFRPFLSSMHRTQYPLLLLRCRRCWSDAVHLKFLLCVYVQQHLHLLHLHVVRLTSAGQIKCLRAEKDTHCTVKPTMSRLLPGVQTVSLFLLLAVTGSF